MGGSYPCGCCCGITSDDFDRSNDTNIGSKWNEVSGDWEVSSNALVCDDTTAICIATKVPATQFVKLTTRFQGTTSDRLRFIIAYQDSSNYWFAEARIGASQTFLIVQRSGGSDTTKASGTISLSAGTTYHLELCVDGNGNITANIRDGSNAIVNGLVLLSVAANPGAGGAGLGTGSTASSSLKFLEFELRKSGTCGDCSRHCPNDCIDQTTIPVAWDLTFPTLTNDACTLGACAQMSNATIRVFYCGACTGFSFCGYRKTFTNCHASFNARLDVFYYNGGVNQRGLWIKLYATAFPNQTQDWLHDVGAPFPMDCTLSRTPVLILEQSFSPCTAPGAGSITAVPVY